MRITRDTLLGLMFFVGLGLLILATVFLSELALGGTRQIPIQFDTAIGLKAGDPVNVVGVKKVTFSRSSTGRRIPRIGASSSASSSRATSESTTTTRFGSSMPRSSAEDW